MQKNLTNQPKIEHDDSEAMASTNRVDEIKNDLEDFAEENGLIDEKTEKLFLPLAIKIECKKISVAKAQEILSGTNNGGDDNNDGPGPGMPRPNPVKG